jgi:hypothetical protein
MIGADCVLIQMASIVKECALDHRKHRIQQPCRTPTEGVHWVWGSQRDPRATQPAGFRLILLCAFIKTPNVENSTTNSMAKTAPSVRMAHACGEAAKTASEPEP